jgi:hypothetical protein
MENLSTTATQITVVILAHRNDELLAQTVKSVEWASEICVVWTGLVQDSPTHFGKHVSILSFTGPVTNFAEVRNYALCQVKTKWVLFLDSDEVLSNQAQPELEKIVTENTYAGIELWRKDIFLGKEMKWGEVHHVSIPRFFQTEKVKYTRAVHEVPEIKGKVGVSQIVIFHFAHDSITQFWSKVTKYINIEAEERFRHGQRISLWQMILWPVGKFIYNYLYKLGFLDGWRGLIYATIMSVHSFSVRASLYEKQSSV